MRRGWPTRNVLSGFDSNEYMCHSQPDTIAASDTAKVVAPFVDPGCFLYALLGGDLGRRSNAALLPHYKLFRKVRKLNILKEIKTIHGDT